MAVTRLSSAVSAAKRAREDQDMSEFVSGIVRELVPKILGRIRELMPEPPPDRTDDILAQIRAIEIELPSQDMPEPVDMTPALSRLEALVNDAGQMRASIAALDKDLRRLERTMANVQAAEWRFDHKRDSRGRLTETVATRTS